MHLKTFTGRSDKEVLDQIKAEFGSEAVIIESRTTKDSGQKLVSMIAALERADGITPTASSMPSSGSLAAANSWNAPQEWQTEWAHIKSHLLALMKPALRLEQLGVKQRAAIEYLQREGANDQALLELYRRLILNPEAPVLSPLTEMLPMRPWGYESWPQRLHLIAGPYGAGKTTVAVRMALALKKGFYGTERGRICIVNADAERGNGRLLLRHYAGLSDLVYREASNAIEMAGILSEIKSQGFDRVFVDLPGLPVQNRLADMLREFGLERMDAIQTALHLVFPPHYDDVVLQELVSRYHLNIPGSLVWSKLDESSRYGAIINIALASGLPISCLSYGPGLLNTLSAVKPAMLWRLLFRHELPINNSSASYIGEYDNE